jgi:gp16 family phage-associated protein
MTQQQIVDKNVNIASKNRLRTANQAKSYLKRNGMTVPMFCKQYGFKAKTVYRVLNGESKCLFGDGYKIAVALGMKAPDSGNHFVTQ